jgi:hypothetical protein
MPGPADTVLLPSVARTATVATGPLKNSQYRGVVVFVNCSAIAATPSVVANIEGWDPGSNTWYLILASTAIVAVSTRKLVVAPGITAAANASVADVLPATWRVNMVHGDADSITYTVSASLVP